jgi:hypothetical protein
MESELKMEKAFKIESNAKYYIDLEKYISNADQQRNLVDEFLKSKGIEANKYRVGANGLVNKPFEEYLKGEIVLDILPTEKDKENFGKMLKKANEYELCGFKKKSKINKEFQDYCVETKMIINLYQPDLRDYLKSMDWHRYSRSLIKHGGIWYLKVQSDLLKDDDIPEGFTEIKLSDFYKVVEDSKEAK